jgi:hypothetical protein
MSDKVNEVYGKRMKLYSLSGQVAIFLITVLLCLILLSTSCGVGQKEGFAIYLADSGELLLSENEIAAYHRDNNTLELNENGIKKWNSHLTYQDIPKLADSLYSRDFILKIGRREICQGKFWSNVSSASYSGVVILDSLVKLDSSQNILWIRSDYPITGETLNPTISTELSRFFGQNNRLK